MNLIPQGGIQLQPKLPGALPIGPPKPQTAPQGGISPLGAPQPQMAPPLASPRPLGPPAPQMAPPAAKPIGMPRPQTMPLAQPIGAPAPQMANSSAPAPIGLAAGSQNYAGLSPIAPGGPTDYTNKTITPGAGVDRLSLAKSNFENFKQSTEPEYQASLREANTAGYGEGQGGSGMLRGRLGDIGLARTRDLQSAETSNLNNATEGSIGDQYRNIGIAQQQQGFQAGQQGTAFNQADEQARLGNDLTNSAFGRAATTTAMGEQGNPSDVGLALSGYYGNQAGQAAQGAGSLIGNSVLAGSLSRNPYLPLPQAPPVNS